MARLIQRTGAVDLRDPLDDSFAALVRSIMYQQLAGAAATAIHGRFLKLFADALSPAAVLALPAGAMRAAGVSGPKEAAITDLARKVGDGTVPLGDVDSQSDDELVERLTKVRGIGRWTAEMFLIFQLRRLDVWPVDDYGVRKGWTLAHRAGDDHAPRAAGRRRDFPALPDDRRVVLLAGRRKSRPAHLTFRRRAARGDDDSLPVPL